MGRVAGQRVEDDVFVVTVLAEAGQLGEFIGYVGGVRDAVAAVGGVVLVRLELVEAVDSAVVRGSSVTPGLRCR